MLEFTFGFLRKTLSSFTRQNLFRNSGSAAHAAVLATGMISSPTAPAEATTQGWGKPKFLDHKNLIQEKSMSRLFVQRGLRDL